MIRRSGDPDAIEKLLTSFVQKAKQLLPGEHDRYELIVRVIEKLGLQIEEDDESLTVYAPEVQEEEPSDDGYDWRDDEELYPEDATDPMPENEQPSVDEMELLGTPVQEPKRQIVL